jgi:PAS domain S-box-containing protein
VKKLIDSSIKELILDNTPVVVAFHDKDYKILWANKAYQQASGLSLKRLVGKKCYSIWKVEKPCDGCPVSKALETGKVCTGELTPQSRTHHPNERKFVLSRATPIWDKGGVLIGAIETSFDITETKHAEEKMLQAMERKNIALREIIEQVEIEKNRVKDDVLANVNELTLPILKRLKSKQGVDRKHIDILTNRLQNLTSSFGRKLTEGMIKLTPKEIEICNLLEGGATSKDIADFLNISYQTVEKHRKFIRKKLGIGNKKVNLTSYLQKMQKSSD